MEDIYSIKSIDSEQLKQGHKVLLCFLDTRSIETNLIGKWIGFNGEKKIGKHKTSLLDTVQAVAI